MCADDEQSIILRIFAMLGDFVVIPFWLLPIITGLWLPNGKNIL